MAGMSQSSRAILLAEIEAFLKRTGMAETAFGRRCKADATLLRRMKAGRDVTLDTADQIRAFMARHDGQQDATSKTGAAA